MLYFSCSASGNCVSDSNGFNIVKRFEFYFFDLWTKAGMDGGNDDSDDNPRIDCFKPFGSKGSIGYFEESQTSFSSVWLLAALSFSFKQAYFLYSSTKRIHMQFSNNFLKNICMSEQISLIFDDL